MTTTGGATSAPPQNKHITVSDPWVSRFNDSALLRVGDGPAGSERISLVDHEVYGDPRHPIRFRIGNGGAGYTGVLKVLAEAFILETGNQIRIGWVSNHSRHTQIALLADVAQVALTYEPENEDTAIKEGWTRRVGRAFNDHFMLVGPADIRLEARTIGDALKEIALSNTGEHTKAAHTTGLLFHSRGDGSATFAKETRLWQAAGVDTSRAEQSWLRIDPLTPYEALVKAEREQAFLITDRATFLTARQDNVIPRLEAHIEGGNELLNPCSVLVRSQSTGVSTEETSRYSAAVQFAEWLIGPKAQEIIREYGRGWKAGHALFTVATKDDFDEDDRLCRGQRVRGSRL
ncbi:hypothetical protein CB0940_02878 [Cercospora beticola]|uniref:PBP domain-containing protein n=1 Tax=Cercospora beticola TaxID=122368 RepID=A0A2G5I2D7_CERBT|nr:hypothetical protein CB0940_02878 [Cercospora beticola]PIA98964.1 hypothetical protein CB0940_02878 [Cercospora beticola]WPB00031.1 hypothetical protein RHO25_004650 [Cercospora beticola]CAK1361792.1 unnamed protein product [Cercospora beticola]